MPNAIRQDPTRTQLIRRRFESEISRRYVAIGKAVVELVEKEDAFGLGARSDGGLSDIIGNAGRWQFFSNPDKIARFKDWFRQQIDQNILTVEDANTAEPWNATYTKSAYKSGAVKSFLATLKALGKKVTGGFGTTRKDFLNTAFDSPEAVSKIKLIYTRAYDQLKNVTSAMEGKITRVLADAIAHGQGPRQVARTLNKEIVEFGRKRSLIVARTEIIHAHAEGQLDTLERLGIQKVTAKVEWLTAANPCPQCAARSGEILTIDQARGLIPYHPNCRCAWAPYVDAFAAADKPTVKAIPTPATKSELQSVRQSLDVKPVLQPPKVKPSTLLDHLHIDKDTLKVAEKEWLDKLSADEKRVVDDWFGTAFLGARNRIAKGEATAADKLFLEALHKAPVVEGTVYRGILSEGGAVSSMLKQIDELGIGGEWIEPAPHSMAGNPRAAFKYANQYDEKLVLKIRTKTGRSVSQAAYSAGEREVIGLDNAKYRIVSIVRNPALTDAEGKIGKATAMVELEEIEATQAAAVVHPKATVSTKRALAAETSDQAVLSKVKDIGASLDDVSALVGRLPKDTTVDVYLNIDKQLVIHAEGVDPVAGKFEIIRSVIDKKTIENVSMAVENQGTGFGSRVFVEQTRELRNRGFEKIETFAAKSKTFNGYKVWPKMGYDGAIPETVAALKGNPPPGGAKLMSDLMRTPEGRAWWEENGRGVDLVFDLKKDSLSSRVLNAYAKRKGY